MQVKVIKNIANPNVSSYLDLIGEMVGASMEYDEEGNLDKTVLHVHFKGNYGSRQFFKDELEEVW